MGRLYAIFGAHRNLEPGVESSAGLWHGALDDGRGHEAVPEAGVQAHGKIPRL